MEVMGGGACVFFSIKMLLDEYYKRNPVKDDDEKN